MSGSKVLSRVTRRVFFNSSDVIGRASGSAAAAAAISASVIGRIGVSGKGRSLPSLITSTIVPSARIFAVVVVLLMLFCPSGRDDPGSVAAFRVGHMQDHALAYA